MKLLDIHIKDFMCFKNTKFVFPNSKIVNIYGIDIDRNISIGIGKCIKGNSLINTSKGLIHIDSLFSDKSKPGWVNLKRPIHVLTKQGNKRKVTKGYNNGYSKTYQLKTTKLNLELEGTPEHPVLVLDKTGEFYFKKLQDIQEGDVVCINRKGIWGTNTDLRQVVDQTIIDLKEDRGHGLQRYTRFKNSKVVLPTKLTQDLAYLLGAYIGDGVCNSSDFRIVLTDLKDTVNKITYTLFKKQLKLDSNMSYTLGSKGLRQYLYYLGVPLGTAGDKRIPHTILKAPKSYVCSFLAGYFDTDGSVNKNGQQIEITSKSKRLIQETQLLLLQLNIISRIKKIRCYASNTKEKIKRDYWILRITSKEQIERFDNLIPLKLKYKKRRLKLVKRLSRSNTNRDTIPFIISYLQRDSKKIKNIDKKLYELIDRYSYNKHLPSYTVLHRLKKLNALSPHLDNILNTHYFFDTIKTKKECHAYTYDMEVPEDHTFISNGFISHNSGIKEAILFALYGKTKVNLTDLIRKGADKCLVALNFEANNKKVEVIRTYRKSTTLEIRIDNKKITFKGVKEKQKFIEDLIDFDYDKCVNFSIFDAIRFEDLSSLSSSEIKRLLQLLFNYNKFNKTYEDLKESIKRNNTLLFQLQNRKTHFYSDQRFNILYQGIQYLNNNLSRYQHKLNTLNNLKYKLVSTISANRNNITKNQRLINWILSKTNCPTCKKVLDNKTAVLNDFQTEINKCSEDNKKVQSRLSRVEDFMTRWNNAILVSSDKIVIANAWLIRLKMAKQEMQDIKTIELEKNKYLLASDTMKKFEMYVIEHYTGYLEQVINEYLCSLIDMHCKISFIKQGSLMTRNIDKFYMKLFRKYTIADLLLDNTPGKLDTSLEYEFPYMSLSSGERMLVAYAFKLAINILNFKDSFLFIDEGLNRLDNNSRQKLLQLLQQSPFNQVFIVSHGAQFTDIPTIYITKQNNESIIDIR